MSSVDAATLRRPTISKRSPSVSNENGTPILLRDVATVRLGPDMRRGLAEFNGQGEVSAAL